MANETGTILICTNESCGCRLRIEAPCPHGDTYTCACGHSFEEQATPTRDLPGLSQVEASDHEPPEGDDITPHRKGDDRAARGR